MREQRIRDWGRRALIALLLVSAVLLLRRTGYYDGIRSRIESSRIVRTERNPEAEAAQPRSAEALMPLAISVRSAEGGGRYGAAYNHDQTAAVFRRFSVDLGEALGSAGAPAECAEEGFRACLDRCSVAMQFACPVRLELLSGWLGVEMSSAAAEHTTQLLCLSASESEALICYRTEDGLCYACTTAVSAEGFRSRAAEYTPNGAGYAWESNRYGLEGYTLLLQELPDIPVLRSAVPLPRESETDAMLTSMGMNSFVASSYSESDGTMVYVSDEATLRISPTGTVLFRRAGTPEVDTDDGITAAVSRAWDVAETCLGKFTGAGTLRVTGAVWNPAQRSYTVTMDFFVNGIPVRLASGHAAELVIRGGKVLQAQLELRRFTRTSERSELLPCLQAAAIAAGAQGRPELIYADAGEATECRWVIVDG